MRRFVGGWVVACRSRPSVRAKPLTYSHPPDYWQHFFVRLMRACRTVSSDKRISSSGWWTQGHTGCSNICAMPFKHSEPLRGPALPKPTVRRHAAAVLYYFIYSECMRAEYMRCAERFVRLRVTHFSTGCVSELWVVVFCAVLFSSSKIRLAAGVNACA